MASFPQVSPLEPCVHLSPPNPFVLTEPNEVCTARWVIASYITLIVFLSTSRTPADTSALFTPSALPAPSVLSGLHRFVSPQCATCLSPTPQIYSVFPLCYSLTFICLVFHVSLMYVPLRLCLCFCPLHCPAYYGNM